MSGASQLSEQTLALMKEAMAAPNAELAKAFTQSGSATTGLTYYDLEAPAKTLYPVITPLRNRIPRVSGKGGIQANWKAITGINVNKISAGLGQGNRGGIITTTTADYNAAYRGIGLDDYVHFEADYAARGFDDVKARAVEGLLRSLMIQEEQIIVGGNSSLALGTTPTPSLSAATTGGALATQTLSVICVALSFEGYLGGSVAGGIAGSVTRTNADGSTDTYGGGSANKSAAAAVAVTGPTGSVKASVSVVNGAVGYAWFWGVAGSELLGAITTINSVNITANAAGTQNASTITADNSRNTLIFDGLISQISTPGSNSYIHTMATGTAGTGTPLTSDGAGGIVEFDTVLQYLWDNFRLSPTDIYMGSAQLQDVGKIILSGASNAAQRFNFVVNQDMIGGGIMVKSYLNKFSMNGPTELPIRLHPNIPPGVIIFYSDSLPYPLSNVSSVLRILTRQDYYQVEWPITSRKYEYGVYADEVLQNYFPPAFAMIRNIARS